MFNLPNDLIREIYEYDPTKKENMDNVLKQFNKIISFVEYGALYATKQSISKDDVYHKFTHYLFMFHRITALNNRNSKFIFELS